jgi:glycosyltransferase involved in cell wall biosynthesis
MKYNKFVIVVTSYNKEKYIGFNINSIKQQSYTNYITIYGYDKSTDNTRNVVLDNIKDDPRFILYDVPVLQSQMNNFFSCFSYLKENNLIGPEDIIVEVDGDDWLLHPFVLQYINQIYQDPNIWMTYGQYIQYPSGQLGGHYNMYIDDRVDATNSYRQYPFPYSHLKTYKVWLLDAVPSEDLINPETNQYWSITADFAMCMPMVEMAGKKRIYRVEEPIYVYNTSNDADNESKSRLYEQKRVEQLIRQIKPKNRL